MRKDSVDFVRWYYLVIEYWNAIFLLWLSNEQSWESIVLRPGTPKHFVTIRNHCYFRKSIHNHVAFSWTSPVFPSSRIYKICLFFILAKTIKSNKNSALRSGGHVLSAALSIRLSILSFGSDVCYVEIYSNIDALQRKKETLHRFSKLSTWSNLTNIWNTILSLVHQEYGQGKNMSLT